MSTRNNRYVGKRVQEDSTLFHILFYLMGCCKYILNSLFHPLLNGVHVRDSLPFEILHQNSSSEAGFTHGNCIQQVV